MSALGDSLRNLADLADAGIISGRSHNLTAHLTTEEEVRALAAILGGEVVEHKSHMDTVQVYVDAQVDKVRVTAIARTDRPWVEPREDDDVSTGVDTYDCPEPGCDFNLSAVGPQDPDEPDYFTEGIEAHERGHDVERAIPDDPTSMALPVIGDAVLLHDGTTARVIFRHVPDPDQYTVGLPDHRTRVVTIDEIAGYPDDDGTEAESLAEVSVPALPDVLAHGRAPLRAMA